MNINPGGVLDPKDIIGRDALIQEYWDILEHQGLILASERRIGKSSIIRKMHHSPREGYLTFSQDVAGISTVEELARKLFEKVADHLPKKEKILGKSLSWKRWLPKKIASIEFSDKDVDWLDALEETVTVLLHATGPHKKVVLFWDEFPVMIDMIRRKQGEIVAMALLNRLRCLRQGHTNLRMVFTGSIGLHLVLRTLALAGNSNTPINDMHSEEVGPLSEKDATDLAERLLSNNLSSQPEGWANLAVYMAQSMQGFAYHIHHVASRLQKQKHPSNRSGVDAALDHLINDPSDPADFKDYADRLDRYYAKDEKPIAHHILDVLSTDEQTLLNRLEIINRVRYQDAAVDSMLVKNVVDLLWRDHYLTRTADQTYRFRRRLVQRWWRENRR